MKYGVMYGNMPSTPTTWFAQAAEKTFRCTASCQMVNARGIAIR